MRTGQYRTYVTFEQFTPSAPGDRGQSEGTWGTLYANVPVELDALTGRTLELARQLVPTATHRVQLRYYSGLTAITTRLNYGGRLFYVGYVDEQHFRTRYLTLLTTEQQGGI